MPVLIKNKLNISNQTAVQNTKCKIREHRFIQEIIFEQLFAKIYLHINLTNNLLII